MHCKECEETTETYDEAQMKKAHEDNVKNLEQFWVKQDAVGQYRLTKAEGLHKKYEAEQEEASKKKQAEK